jgi:hypothetical protein
MKWLTGVVVLFVLLLAILGLSTWADVADRAIKAWQAEQQRPPSPAEVIMENRRSLAEAEGRPAWVYFCPPAVAFVVGIVLVAVFQGPVLIKEIRLTWRKQKPRRRRSEPPAETHRGYYLEPGRLSETNPISRPPESPNRWLDG